MTPTSSGASLPLTVGAARAWDVDEPDRRALRWRAAVEQVSSIIESHVATTAFTSDTWAGTTAETARDRALRTAAVTRCVPDLLDSAATIAQRWAPRLRHARSLVLTTVDRAEQEGFTVADNGIVVPSEPLLAPADSAVDPARQRADLTARAERLTADVTGYLRELERCDRDAAAALHGLVDSTPRVRAFLESPIDTIDGAGPPSADADPATNRSWWESLTDAERARILADEPESVGRRDGLPAEVRDHANRQLLPQLRLELEDTRDQMVTRLAALDGRNSGGPEGPATMVERRELVDGIAAVETRLRDLDAIGSAIDGDDNRLLLLLDTTSGEQTHAAIAVGNPDTADHVSVTTGGITTTAHGSLPGMVDEAVQLRREAITQLQAADRAAETVATVAWLGYDAPQFSDGAPGLGDIVSRANAERGGADLSDFVRGLDTAAGDRDVNVSAFGHSYGSLTTSLALQHDPDHGVDNVVFYGSPGIGTMGLGLPERLGVEPGSIFDMTGDADAVARIPWFGTNPAAMTTVEHLSTEPTVTPDGVARGGATEHSDYPRLGDNGELRISGYNLAAILAETGNEVRR